MNVIDRYRSWFDYEKQAHQKVLASLATVPRERRTEPAFQKALELFGHLVGARAIWLRRLGASEKKDGPLFPESVTPESLPALLEEMHDTWTTYLGTLSDRDLERVFEYASFEGPRFRNRVEDVLAQLFGHSWYHRGQIASLVKASGGQPAETDLIFWTRQPVAS